MLVISHHGEETELIAAVEYNTPQKRIDEIIIESFSGWCCPPEDNYELVREDDAIFIKYETGHIDYDGDGHFTVREVPFVI